MLRIRIVLYEEDAPGCCKFFEILHCFGSKGSKSE